MGKIVKWVVNLLRLYGMGNPFLMRETSSFKKFIYLVFWLCWVFVATCGLSLAVSEGHYLIVFQGLLVVVAALVVEHRLWKNGLSRSGTWALLPAACGILLDKGANTCTLNGQADSQLVDHQGSPGLLFLI